VLRLAPKIRVATTTTIASAPPTIAERMGAAFEPLPGSTAKTKRFVQQAWTCATSAFGSASDAGLIISTRTSSRQLQFGLKLIF